MTDFPASPRERTRAEGVATLRMCCVVGAAWRVALTLLLVATCVSCAGFGKNATALLSGKGGFPTPPLTPGMIDELGILAFRIDLTTLQRSDDARETALAEKVMGRILEAVGHTQFAATARQFDWEVVVVKEDQALDAVAFPGGKIIVRSGLLRQDRRSPLTGSAENRLAVALGHEVVHALARHMAQRVDKELQQALVLAMTGKQLSELKLDPAATAGLMAAMGAQYEGAVIRPFTGEQELEADHQGLLITARAGYDPKTAVEFWEQIQRLSNGKQPLEILSLHPSYDTRIGQLKSWMAEARHYYQAAAATRSQSTGERG
jgi:predicted Zn-dependent protease